MIPPSSASRMLSADFQTWSLVHATTLLVCGGAVSAAPLLVRRSRSDHTGRRVRSLIGWGCLVAWLLNTAYWMMPERFDLASSLPIHFCNVANIFGALAVLGRIRLFQGVIYFWAGLYIWAFLTPTVDVGPARLGFWVFWIYHAFIVLALTQVLIIDRFRPTLADLLRSSGFTLIYVGLLAILDRFTGWNYGFLGAATPSSPTLVDVLGPYPLRLIWMILIGVAVFFVLWLPFAPRGASARMRAG